MNVGTPVRNEYQGIIRYGKIKNSYKDPDGWSWFDVDWVDDQVYQNAISHRNSLSGKDHLKKYYRADELSQIDINKTIETLLKLK